MATLVTFESVAAAAEVIVATGKRPSVRTIAAALGGGSPNSILVHLRDWQSWRPVAGIADIDIDAQIIDGIKKQIQMTAARAAATAEEKAASTEDDLQAVSAEQAEAKQQITTLIDELDKSKDQVNALTKQIDTERADAERFAQTAQIAYAAMRALLHMQFGRFVQIVQHLPVQYQFVLSVRLLDLLTYQVHL